MEYLYKFEVKWYDEIGQKTLMSKGLVAATTYTEAAQKLSHMFGEDLVNNMAIRCLSDSEGGVYVEQEEEINE
nr:MAG TPA: hypothetical protein [Caudoviricetes sp.]